MFLVLYTSITVVTLLAGCAIVGITRYTLGRARDGGFILIVIGSSFSSLSYTLWTGKYDGVALLGTLVAYGSLWWVYIRRRLEKAQA